MNLGTLKVAGGLAAAGAGVTGSYYAAGTLGERTARSHLADTNPSLSERDHHRKSMSMDNLFTVGAGGALVGGALALSPVIMAKTLGPLEGVAMLVTLGAIAGGAIGAVLGHAYDKAYADTYKAHS